jgi:tetratricopeptide (TPR) repeat protein
VILRPRGRRAPAGSPLTGVLLAALACLLGSAVAGAQTRPPAPLPPRGFVITIPAQGSSRPVPPLGPAELTRLSRARTLWMSGDTDAARDTLARLLQVVPHHPVVLAELAQVERARGDWRAIEQLARSERAAVKDSVLLATEYAEALEQLKRPKDAAQVLLESWIAAPELSVQVWPQLDRLASASPREVSQATRPVTAARPDNAELARFAAGLAWRQGDARDGLAILRAADRNRAGTPVRWTFAEETVNRGTAPDSAAAAEVYLDLAGDTKLDASFRLPSARRAFAVTRRTDPAGGATRLARALQDLPPDRWGDDLLLGVARALRESGQTDAARALLERSGGPGRNPDVELERALGNLRERPDARVIDALGRLAPDSPEAGFHYAEALFFAGRPDSAVAWYKRVSQDPKAPMTGAALERLFLIEEAQPREALPAVGRLEYEAWRGDAKRAGAVAESLVTVLPHGPLWAHAALALATQRETLGDGKAALAPLLAVADSLPDDRLAPLARQRAGDVLRRWYRDDARALAQYEECLARYPRAWNAPEVRRVVESMRRERRF